MTLFRFNYGLSRLVAILGQPLNGFRFFTVLVPVTLVALFLCGVMASAQVETGQIAGTVMDQTGAAVPNAAVTIKNLSTNSVRNTISSESGAYLAPGLEPAVYQVSVNSNSFQPFVAKVEVTVGGHVILDAKLSVSAATTEVEVVGEGGEQVNTQTQEMSRGGTTARTAAPAPSIKRAAARTRRIVASVTPSTASACRAPKFSSTA